MSTPFHSKYYAHELTKRCSSDSLEKLSQSLNNATIDLNPHQVDAALFAFKSPLSRGAVLADEVGLGKTIEAGLIMSQLWAEGKRRMLCILPAALRAQWERELAEKFFIDALILESGNYKALQAQGVANPFEQKNRVILCSFQFARREAALIQRTPWDLVVLDEAHRMRNVYKSDNKIARAIRDAINLRPKILLTATPLQNSIMELYGLVSFIDPHLFGGFESFRDQFAKRIVNGRGDEFSDLKRRIQPILIRTLRRQVSEYVRYTDRRSHTQDFTPSDQEWELYEAVSAYLQRPQSYALPASQRALITLVLRKILASSSFAIADTLGTLIKRLEAKEKNLPSADGETSAALASEYESLVETKEEWDEGSADAASAVGETAAKAADAEREAIRKELEDLKNYKKLAESITQNEKGAALLTALNTGMAWAEKLGAKRKALIFTESRRTQTYLKELLGANGYAGQLVTFNGTNTDPDSRRIYKEWLARHEGQDCVSGAPSADIRSALVEEFQDRAAIMIATESASEGINLQFCSLVVNYDLPWNPQRIEQRIGRCHRYGQQHDVVVINFVNRKNAADKRVFELLSQKFKLFEGIFGASDQVLGALESGVDFEKRVNDIYQSCRTTEEINAAFDRLQQELELQIQSRMETAKSQLLEHFDVDVQQRLKLSQDGKNRHRSRFHQLLWWFAKAELRECAEFSSDEAMEFVLKSVPTSIESIGVKTGRYTVVPDSMPEGAHHFRVGHPLAERLIAAARSHPLEPQTVRFDYDRLRKVTPVEILQGLSGWLDLHLVSLDSLEPEDHLVFSGLRDDGQPLSDEACRRLFDFEGKALGGTAVPDEIVRKLDAGIEAGVKALMDDTQARNRNFFDSEIEKLEHWADDLKGGLESELKELQREITSLKREFRQAVDLQTKIDLQRKVAELERKRSDKRKGIFEAQDRIDSQKDEVLSKVEERLKLNIKKEPLFTIRWRVEAKA